MSDVCRRRWLKWLMIVVALPPVFYVGGFFLYVLTTPISRVPVSADPRERLLRDFDIIAFNTENKTAWWDITALSRLRKWDTDIVVFVDGPRKSEIQPLVLDQMRLLENLTGLRFTMTDQKAKSNFAVYYLYKNEYPKFSAEINQGASGKPETRPSFTCWLTARDDQHKIVFAQVVLIADNSISSMRHCVAEEMTQALGLFNDSVEVVPSLFNDRSKDEHLTAKDIALVKLLYDPRLKVDMRRRIAIEQARKIIYETYSLEQAAHLSTSENPTNLPRLGGASK